jgi:hypothetical protein
MEKNMFEILKVTEERSRIRSWIRIRILIRIQIRGTDPANRICTKLSRIPNTDLTLADGVIYRSIYCHA